MTSFKKIFSRSLPLGVGLLLIWLSIKNLKSSEWNALILNFKEANYYYVALTVVLALVSHWIRTLRWCLLFDSLGYRTNLRKNYAIVLSSYIVHLAFPRGGDIYKSGMAQRYENIPFNKALGTVVLERLADSLMLLLIILISLFFSFEKIKMLAIIFWSKLSQTNLLMLCIGLLTFLLLAIWVFKKKGLSLKKLSKWISQFKEGLKSIKRTKKIPFVFYSFGIWFLYVLMFYVASLAIPQLEPLHFGAIIVTFVLASFSYALTNGGLGAYPITVQQSLVFFGYSKIFSLSLGWIIWGSQTLMVLFFGSLSILYLSLSNTKKIGKN